MNMDEIMRSNENDLKNRIVELRKELVKLNSQVATGTQLKSPSQIKVLKRNIARIMTVLKNKERNAQG